MRPSTIAAVGGAVTVALLAAPMIAQAQNFQRETWADWASLTDYSGADTTQWTGIPAGGKTVMFVGAGSGVTVQGGTVDPTDQTFDGDWFLPNSSYYASFEADPSSHSVTMDTVSGQSFTLTGLTGKSTAIQYIINIDDSTFPADDLEYVFEAATLSVDANNPGGGATTFEMKKRVQGLTPTGALPGGEAWTLNTNFDIGEIFDATTAAVSANTTSQTTVFCGSCTTWLVTDFITVFNTQAAGDNRLNSFTNGITQTIPAPGALVLIATGLIGIGASRRRARKG